MYGKHKPMLINSADMSHLPPFSHWSTLGEFPPSDFPPPELQPWKSFLAKKMDRIYELREMISIYNCVLFLQIESF